MLERWREIHCNSTDNLSDSSPTSGGFRSEEMELKQRTYSDCAVDKRNAQMKKSQSLGSRLNRRDCSDIGTNNIESSMSDQLQEDMLSDSVQIGSDLTKDMSMFSIGDPQKGENQNADKDDNHSSLEDISGDGTPPHIRSLLVRRSSSSPSMGSPNECRSSFLPSSRSAQDLNVLDSRKKGLMLEVDALAQYQERDNSESYNGDNTGGNLPVLYGENMDKVEKGETLNHHGEELPAKDFKLKRIEEWVSDLQQCSPLKEHTESAPCSSGALSKGNALIEDSTALKMEAKGNPGTDAAKRYISSLNASAPAAQLTNLGLVAIPSLGAFASLKALNLSGNAIVRISTGALPRGLHILNLSKNHISTIEGLRDLTRLRVLDLSYNRILRIGHGLASCSSLKELYLAGNKISEVEGLHRLLKLNVLDLRCNKISTTKCLDQLAANYGCLQALSLEGNPSQKNVGDEQLKKYVMSLLPHLTYYNRQSIKSGTPKDTAERSARLGIGAHQMDRGLQLEVKTTRKGSHGIAAQKVSSSSHTLRNQAVASPKSNKSSKHAFRPPMSGMKTTFGHQFTDMSSKLRTGIRSRSEGNLGDL